MEGSDADDEMNTDIDDIETSDEEWKTIDDMLKASKTKG